METTEFQKIAIRNLKMVGIEIEIIDALNLKIIQRSIYNGYILTKKELVDRAKKVFPEMIIKPIRFSLDVGEIDCDWIKKQNEKHRSKR